MKPRSFLAALNAAPSAAAASDHLNAAKGTDSSVTKSGLGGAAEPLLEKSRFSSRLPGGTWISADKKLTIDCTGHVLTFIE
jgi:hypothetical protein